MKKSILFSVFILVGILAKATDLLVEENGLSPSYSSITAALAAASSGDRIFIKNKAGNLPWLENITISKSVDLLSFVNDSFFIMQGTVTVSPTTFSTINIIGMINLNGGISVGTSPTGNRTILRILDCQLAGGISQQYNNYDLTVYGCTVSGSVSYMHGSIVGNVINAVSGYGINILSESVATTDTSYIFGNKITTNASASYGIYWTSTTMISDIRNNFITTPYSGIYVGGTVGTSQLNKIYNNTISLYNASQGGGYAIYVAGGANANIDIQNNVLDRNSAPNYTYYGIYASPGSGGTTSVTYNFIDNIFSSQVSGAPTVNLNNTVVSLALNVNGSTQSSVGLNGGNPGVQFYDTDLTINDAGCYGGSYTLNNFFPQFTGAANTWLTNYQFNIRTGNTLSIKASSVDR